MTHRDINTDTRPFPTKCEKCQRSIDDININWNAPREPVCVVCAYPRLLTANEAKRALAQLAEDDE